MAMVARKRPVRPPMVNRPMNPNAYSIGVSKEMEPRYMVAVQLNTLIAEGTATRKLMNEKTMLAYMDCPATKRWCPHTRNPSTAIATLENATKLYPKIALREKHAMISLMTAMPGRIMMYTAGCE